MYHGEMLLVKKLINDLSHRAQPIELPVAFLCDNPLFKSLPAALLHGKALFTQKLGGVLLKLLYGIGEGDHLLGGQHVAEPCQHLAACTLVHKGDAKHIN